MRAKYEEREKQYMIEALMKKKNINQKHLEEHSKGVQGKNNYDDDISKIRFDTDETYRDVVKKMLDFERTEEYGVSTKCFFLLYATCYIYTLFEVYR